MSEVTCVECGEVLTNETTTCPKCGCPVEKKEEVIQEKVESQEEVPQKDTTKKELSLKKKLIMPLIAIVIGVVIIIMGVNVMGKKATVSSHDAESYDAEYAAFGGDFYTEIYGATDIIVDELDSINAGTEVLSKQINAGVNAVYYASGMIMIALGLGVIAVAVTKIER